MVIDDDRRVLDSLLDYLDDVGFRTTGFTAPQEALQAIRANPPDVCMVDLRLPGINGEHLLREIITSTPGVRCLIYTGSLYIISEELKSLGMTQADVIRKPVQDFDMLSQKIAGVL
jgi:DNA-binding NtrC family response regulator